MRKSPGMIDLLTGAALLLVAILIGIAVWGVILRHAEEHGHNIAKTHAFVPRAQGGEAGPLREANDGGGVHAFSYAPGSLSDAVRRRRNGSDMRK